MSKSARVLYTLGHGLAFLAFGITQAQTTLINSRGKTTAEVLRDYGIGSSEPSLLKALQNPNARIRVLAAHQLAVNLDKGAIPAVEHAFQEERDSMARVGIATAMASLHDPNGLEHLQEICADNAGEVKAAITAVQMIQMLRGIPAGCTDAMLNRLQEAGSKDYRDAIIPMLADLYSTATNDQAAKIVSGIEQMLTDKDQQPSIKLAAGQSLAQIGVSSALPALKYAVSTERDAVVSAALKNDLEVLQRKVGPSAN